MSKSARCEPGPRSRVVSYRETPFIRGNQAADDCHIRAGSSCRINTRRRVLEYQAFADGNLESLGGQQEASRVRLAALNIFELPFRRSATN